jgi:hypothetical protein
MNIPNSICASLIALSLVSCSNEPNALTCRKAERVGNGYRIKTVLEIGFSSDVISISPLKCQNMIFTFHGGQPNSILNRSIESDRNRKLDHTRYQIDATGKLATDDVVKVPVLQVEKINYLKRL